MEFNGQPRVKNALKLMQSPVQFGGQSYSLRGYMQDADIVKLADEEYPGTFVGAVSGSPASSHIFKESDFYLRSDPSLHDELQRRERQFRPGMFWWMEDRPFPD